jgi:hypothetical protein
MIPSITGRPTQSVQFSTNLTSGAQVTQTVPDGWRLEIPAGPQGSYRLAQLDDYAQRPRGQFPWKPPLSLALSARVSTGQIQGTWGFGLWNDPFSFSMGFGGGARRFPALPNAVWFFFAAPQNHLSLRDDLPSNGNLAAIFQAPTLPAYMLIPGLLALPFMAVPPAARLLRRWARRFIRQEAVSFGTDITQWHRYGLVWESNRVSFALDDTNILESTISPDNPLGLVIWIDNQFLAWTPNGRLGYGNLETPQPCWVEIKDLHLE